MGAFDNLLRRWGYVRLDRFGLVLTPEDRVVSTRPLVLDDGSGARIVGWTDHDLAAMQLPRWDPLQPAPLPAVAPRAAVAPPRIAQPIAPPPPVPPPRPAVVMPAAPAPEPEPVVPVEEDDDWEWVIAIARARAAAEEQEITFTEPHPVVAPPPPPPAPPQRSRVPTRQVAVPPPLPPAPVAPPVLRHHARADSSPATVIPVPRLPHAKNPVALRPVVRASQPPAGRLKRPTAPVEDTIRTYAAPPANDDRTSPSISLPPAATTIGLATAKRVAAKQR